MLRTSQYVSDRGQLTIDQFLATDIDFFRKELQQLEAQIDPESPGCRGDAIHQRVAALLQASVDACRQFELEHADDVDLVRTAQAAFRREMAPWLRHSWFADRAHRKPSGFSGDFEMLLKIYAEATPARGLGAYMDLCMVDLQLAQAVRSRLRAVREFLMDEIERRSGRIRVLDVACGPCREYLNWPDIGSEREVEIVALDNDPVALAYVEANVVPQMAPHMRLQVTRYNAIRTQNAAANIRKFGKFDIIYSSGLCDYLTDDMLIGMLSGWRETLNEGGVMYVAFKDARRYDKTPYQWHLDWFFYQRTLKDCLSLYERAGFEVEAMEALRDASGIIISFINRTRRDRFVRIDPGHDKAARPQVVSQPADQQNVEE